MLVGDQQAIFTDDESGTHIYVLPGQSSTKKELEKIVVGRSVALDRCGDHDTHHGVTPLFNGTGYGIASACRNVLMKCFRIWFRPGTALRLDDLFLFKKSCFLWLPRLCLPFR